MHQAPAEPSINMMKLARKPKSSSAMGISLQAVGTALSRHSNAAYAAGVQYIGESNNVKSSSAQMLCRAGLFMSCTAHLHVYLLLQTADSMQRGFYDTEVCQLVSVTAPPTFCRSGMLAQGAHAMCRSNKKGRIIEPCCKGGAYSRQMPAAKTGRQHGCSSMCKDTS